MATIVANHFVLAVHELEGEVRFFVEGLGFEVALRPAGWVFVKKDNCMVMLGECPDDMLAREIGCHRYFGYLRVDDAARYHAELRGRGVKGVGEISDKPWGMREFAVETPEGHQLTVGELLATAA